MRAGRKYNPKDASTPELTRMQREVALAVERLDDQAQIPASTVRVIVGGEHLSPLDAAAAFYGPTAASVTLPLASGNGARAGQRLVVLALGLGALTVVASGLDTIGGASRLTLPAGQAALLASDGLSQWQAVPAGVTSVKAGSGGTPIVGALELDGAGTVTVTEAGQTITITGAADGRGWPSYAHIAGGSGLTNHLVANVVSVLGPVTGNPAANTLFALPFIAPQRGGTLDRLDFEVTTLLAGNGRVGLYDNVADGNLYPNNLLADGGSVSTNTTGVKSTTVSVALNGGALYWLAFVQSAAATIRCANVSQISTVLGVTALGGVGNHNVGLSVAFTFGALPTPFTASATYFGLAPIPWLRARIS